MRPPSRQSGMVWLALVAGCGVVAGCGAAGPIVTQPPAPPAKQAAAPVDSPALAQFRAAARKMAITYTPPAGFAEVPVRDNSDQSYDYAVASADKRIEIRFTLRPYDRMPEPLRNRDMSFAFFMTGVSNVVHGGDDGRFADPQAVPAAHFNADDARLVALRWFATNLGTDAFSDGYECGSAIFMHRDVVGDAYTYILLRDRAALADMDEETMHAMRFAAR
jgi:hypothetical protein